jgi:hypothetical protein
VENDFGLGDCEEYGVRTDAMRSMIRRDFREPSKVGAVVWPWIDERAIRAADLMRK